MTPGTVQGVSRGARPRNPRRTVGSPEKPGGGAAAIATKLSRAAFPAIHDARCCQREQRTESERKDDSEEARHTNVRSRPRCAPCDPDRECGETTFAYADRLENCSRTPRPMGAHQNVGSTTLEPAPHFDASSSSAGEIGLLSARRTRRCSLTGTTRTTGWHLAPGGPAWEVRWASPILSSKPVMMRNAKEEKSRRT
jgi:hypothetical protein